MRFLLILAAIAALPALVAAHWNHFLNHRQGPLLAQVLAALDEPRFAGVRKDGSIINYLDISLYGQVADPATRDEARLRVAAIPGVRCREMDNHLLVTPAIQGAVTGEKLTLSGWLRDPGTLENLTRWLREARPGLEVDTSAIRISPHTARIDLPRTGASADAVPPELAEVWGRLRLPAALRISKQGNSIRASGALPSAALRENVIAAALGTRAETTMDARDLRGGAAVLPARFTHESALPGFLLAFFSLPSPATFEAREGSIFLHGHATPEREQEWNRFLVQMADPTQVTVELRRMASVYHLPGYRPESRLAPEALQTLRASLATASTHFGYAVHTVSPEEIPRLASAAQAILAAGAEARIIVGAHLDWVGEPHLNEDSARRRVEAVIGELKSRGVPAAQLEAAVFGIAPGPDGGDQGRTVELLVK